MPINQDDESNNTGFFSGLIKANNDAYQKRKQSQTDSNAIALDKINMDMNPNAVGPKQDSSLLAQPLPAERENLEQNILPMVTSGSIGSGNQANAAYKVAKAQNIAELPQTKQWTSEGMQALLDQALKISNSPTIPQDTKFKVFQKLKTAMGNARVRGVKLPEGY